MNRILAIIMLLLAGMAQAFSLGAQPGLLDLSGVNFAESGIVELRADWEFYWQEHLAPEDFNKPSLARKKRYFPVPKLWNGQKLDNLPLEGNSYATYRLLVKMPAGQHMLWLSLKDLPTSYYLWLNGELVMQSGVPGKDKLSSQPGVGEKSYRFVNRGEDLELILQVASFHHRSGGTWHAPRLGLLEHMERESTIKVALDMLVLSCVFVMALYHFVIYWLRSSDASPLALAIFCSCIAIRVAVAGDGQLASRFFDISFMWYRRLELFSFYAAVPTFLSFAFLIYPQYMPRRQYQILIGASLMFVAASLILPIRQLTETITYLQILALIAIFRAMATFFRAVVNRQDGSLIFAMGGMAVTTTAINDMLVARQIIQGSNLVGFGLYTFIFLQSVAIAKIFATAFRDLKSSQQTIQDLNEELKLHIDKLDHLVEDKTREVRSIMTHIKQGICMIEGEELRIMDEYSRFLEDVTGTTQLASKKFMDLVFADSDIEDSVKLQTEQALVSALEQEEFSFDVNRHLLINEFRRTRPDGRVDIFELDWNPILGEDGLIKRYLISIRNVSQLRELQEEALRNEVEWAVVKDLLTIPAKKLPDLMYGMQKLLTEILDLVRSNYKQSRSQISQTNKNKARPLEFEMTVFRLLHTMKGNAHSFGMSTLASAVHRIEVDWSTKSLSKTPKELRLQKLGELEKLLSLYQHIIEDKLHWGKSSSENGVHIPWSLLKRILKILKPLARDESGSTRLSFEQWQGMKQIPLLLSEIAGTAYQPISHVMNDIMQSLRNSAEKLGKELPKLQLNDSGIMFDPADYQFLFGILGHLVRNSLSHGLETVEQRLAKGKPAQGSIRLDVTYHNHKKQIQMSYSDDGAGFHLSAIRSRGIHYQLISPDETDPQKILDLVFHPDFSTMDKATEIAGRGIGLDAVRYMLKKRQGDIQLKLVRELEKGYCQCTLEIEFFAEVWHPANLPTAS